MKSVIRLVLLTAFLLLSVSYDGRTDPGIRAEQQDYPDREMRSSSPPQGWEEIQRRRNVERSENTEWLKEVTEKYSPESWYLLMNYDALPESTQAPLPEGGIVT